MPPKRVPVARRASVARRAPSARTANNPARNARTTTDAPMIVVAINQLIKTRVAEALVNQEQLRNNDVNGDGSQNSRSRTERPTRTPRECTFKDFLNCQPLTFKVKFDTCTFLGNALTWWNFHMKTVTQDVAYAMDWKTLKNMIDKYCLRGEIKKLEIELWNLKVKGTDVASYTLRFQELALMCGRMFRDESDKVEKYVGRLPDMIWGNVMSYQPKRMENQLSLLMIKWIKKSSLLLKDKLSRRESKSLMLETIRVQVSPPWPVRCKVHELQESRPFDKGCWNPTTTNNQRTITCYECGNQGHYRSDFLKLRNQNYGNQAGDTKAHGVVYALGGEETDQDPSNIEDEIEA
ncbi:hypothetical protein Tco_0260814 [Tanacetum coccineum]